MAKRAKRSATAGQEDGLQELIVLPVRNMILFGVALAWSAVIAPFARSKPPWQGSRSACSNRTVSSRSRAPRACTPSVPSPRSSATGR